MLVFALFILPFVAGEVDDSNLAVIRNFETPSKVSDAYLSIPNNMVFSPEGKLFLLDQSQSKVFVWPADGRFLKSFGGKGQGPGELLRPTAINATSTEIIVWDDREDMSVFDHDGNFIERFSVAGWHPRTFTPLDEDRMLIGCRNTKLRTKQGHDHFSFALVSRSGKTLKTLLSFPDLSNLAPGSEKERLKPYRPEVDIQKDEAGHVYIGFSQNTVLYRLNDQGDIVQKLDFALPAGPPNEAERDAYTGLTVLKNGRRMPMVDPASVDFEREKAYYTHFLVKGGKVAFVLTPYGGLWGVPGGYSAGSYYIADLQSGTALTRGRYAYPEDSAVFFRNGRILACVMGKDGAFDLFEAALKGL